MPTTDSQSLIDQLNWRYATKTFDPEKTISDETIAILEESLRLTPSSFGLQPWKFFIVTDPEFKGKMPAISWNQSQPKDCSHMVVLAAKTQFSREDVGRFIDSMAATRGGSAKDFVGYEEFAGGFVDQAAAQGWIGEWAKRQVYIALGQLMLTAAMLEVDACPMEGIQAPEYDKLLSLEGSGYETVVACPLGYRAEGDKYASLPKVRYSADEVIERR